MQKIKYGIISLLIKTANITLANIKTSMDNLKLFNYMYFYKRPSLYVDVGQGLIRQDTDPEVTLIFFSFSIK